MARRFANVERGPQRKEHSWREDDDCSTRAQWNHATLVEAPERLTAVPRERSARGGSTCCVSRAGVQTSISAAARCRRRGPAYAGRRREAASARVSCPARSVAATVVAARVAGVAVVLRCRLAAVTAAGVALRTFVSPTKRGPGCTNRDPDHH